MRLSMKSEGGGGKEKVAGAIHVGAGAWFVNQASGGFTKGTMGNHRRSMVSGDKPGSRLGFELPVGFCDEIQLP